MIILIVKLNILFSGVDPRKIATFSGDAIIMVY